MTNNLAQEIQHRLKILGLTPITAAHKAGLPRDSIRDIIRGKSLRPSHALLVKVASALNCTIEDLTGEKASPEGLLGFAFEDYHSLDWRLCLLFARITRLPSDDAGLIYFALGQAARLQVLRELKQMHHPDLYESFWNSFLAEVSLADTAYNEMLRLSQKYSTRYSLEELGHIRDRVGKLHVAAFLFDQALTGWGVKRHQSWAAALEVPLVLPPPADHPFSAVLKEADELSTEF